MIVELIRCSIKPDNFHGKLKLISLIINFQLKETQNQNYTKLNFVLEKNVFWFYTRFSGAYSYERTDLQLTVCKIIIYQRQNQLEFETTVNHSAWWLF